MSTATVARTEKALDTKALDAIDRLTEVRDLIASLDKEKVELNNLILAALDGADAGTKDGKVRIVASRRQRSGVDARLLEEAFPEAFAATRTTTDYTVLVVK